MGQKISVIESSRQRREGPEEELIQKFLASVKFYVPHGCALTFFKEPSLDSGFPDLVAVIWRITIARKWPNERNDITSKDIRILHYLATNGPSEINQLQQIFRDPIMGNINQLKKAKLVVQNNTSLKAKPLKTIFAVRNIIAIEAKIRDWKRALHQAWLNQWFCSESYILIPHMPKGTQLTDSAKKTGIGIYVMSDDVQQWILKINNNLPKSYASWLFNEWAWKTAHSSGII